MSDGSKYMSRHEPITVASEVRDGYLMPLNHNRVTTRAYGDIPGILPAFDIFVSIPSDVMQAATAARSDEYCHLQNTLKHQDFMNHPIHYSDITLNVLKNPSAKVRKPWDHDFQG